MAELNKQSVVSLVSGKNATIIKEIGRGGQGIVYLVEIDGEQKALKWYLNAPDDKFYRNLEHNIISGHLLMLFCGQKTLQKNNKVAMVI